jgi:hypothetical protein
MYLRRVRLTNDCANVVCTIEEGNAWDLNGQIVREIKSIKRDFEALELLHENHRSNVDAHNLARPSLYASYVGGGVLKRL